MNVYIVKTFFGVFATIRAMNPETSLASIESTFMALADNTRLRILNLLREDEICVCFFTEALGESQPKVSRHLAYLRKSGLVETRRDGKWMHYRLSEPEEPEKVQLIESVLDWLWTIEAMRDDYAKLSEVCCALDAPVTIARAPKPEVFVEREPEVAVQSVQEPEELETYLL